MAFHMILCGQMILIILVELVDVGSRELSGRHLLREENVQLVKSSPLYSDC